MAAGNYKFALIAAAMILGGGCGRPASVPSTGKLSALDMEGRTASPFIGTNTIATVLVFMAVDCPISNRYAPVLRRLRERFGPEGVSIWIVYPDKDTPLSSIREHVRAFSLGDQILRDPEHVLVKASRVRTTPEAAVFARTGALSYHGAIDDRFVELGQERSQPTHKYLEDALLSLINGQPVPVKQTAAIGCPIPDLPRGPE